MVAQVVVVCLVVGTVNWGVVVDLAGAVAGVVVGATVVATEVGGGAVEVGASVVVGALVDSGLVGAGVPVVARVVAGDDRTVAGGASVEVGSAGRLTAALVGGRVVTTRRTVVLVAMVGPGALGLPVGRPAMARPTAAPQNSTIPIR